MVEEMVEQMVEGRSWCVSHISEPINMKGIMVFSLL